MVSYCTIWISYCTIWYHIVQYGTILYNMVSYCTIWYHIVQYYIILLIILYYNILYYIIGVGEGSTAYFIPGRVGWGVGPRQIRVCRLSVPPPATHPRPTPTNGSIHGSIQDRSRVDPGIYHILHDLTTFYTKIDKIHMLARIFAPARNTDRRK